MTPKEEAEKLLKEFGSRGTPFNDAGIFVSEMIYEIEKYNSDNKSEIWYWEKVEEELEKMRINQKTNNESELGYKENDEEELEEMPIHPNLKYLLRHKVMYIFYDFEDVVPEFILLQKLQFKGAFIRS